MNVRIVVDVDRAAIMWQEDKTVAEIAEFFRVSKGKIAGIMNRKREIFPKKTNGRMDIHLKGQVKTVTKKARAARTPKQGTAEPIWPAAEKPKPLTDHARMEAVANDVLEFKAGTSRYLRTHPDDVTRQVRGKLLVDLESHECRFAVNSGSPYLFCAESTNGGSWCSHHAMRVYSARKIA